MKLRDSNATTGAASASDEESAALAPSFQVESSLVIGAAAASGAQDIRTSGGTPPDPPSLAGLPKELIDHPRYRVVAVLGIGGMGAVYRAEHRLMDRPVVLKLIRSELLGNEALVQRFRREVRAAAHLPSHPNIVTAHDAEQIGRDAHSGHGIHRGHSTWPTWSTAAEPCRWAKRANTSARRRWHSSTPSKTAWSTATSSRRI